MTSASGASPVLIVSASRFQQHHRNGFARQKQLQRSVTDTALGTVRSLEATVQGFEERAERLALDITDANKRVRELGEKVGAKFEREDRFQELTRRQSEIEEKLDLTKNQASSQVDATSDETQKRPSKHNRNLCATPNGQQSGCELKVSAATNVRFGRRPGLRSSRSGPRLLPARTLVAVRMVRSRTWLPSEP